MLAPIRNGVNRLFRLALGRVRDARQDADDELEAHLQERADLLVARGMPVDQARAEAARRLGAPVDDVRRALRRSAERRERYLSWSERIREVVSDVRYAMRGLRREPVVSGFAIATLGLGLGANAAMFGLVDRLLLRGPAHVVDPPGVVQLFWTMRQPNGLEATSARGFDRPVYPNLVAESRAFSSIAVYAQAGQTLFSTGAGDARMIPRASVTASFFATLGVRPAVGRFFTVEEQEATPPSRVVVLGHGLWQSDFGADPAAVGRTITLGRTTYTIVGVAPQGFTGATHDRVDIWTPLAAPRSAATRHWTRGHTTGTRLIARLKPGVTLAAAGEDATATHRRTYDGEESHYAQARISVGPLFLSETAGLSAEAQVARWLMGLSAIVLLIACANIVNLLLARGVRRKRELAVRASLGAGRGRLVRLLLVETLTLAVLGGLAGLILAVLTGKFVHAVLLPSADWSGGMVDGRVLSYAALATLTVGLLMGSLPALNANRADLVSALKAGARDGGGRGSVLRNGLTMAQAGLAMILLVGAGLFVRSFQRVRTLDLGIQTDRVVSLSPRFPTQPNDDWRAEGRRRDDFALLAAERLRAHPAVENAAVTVGLPFGGWGTVTLRVPGRDSLPILGSQQYPTFRKVSPEYFGTVGTKLIRGRLFTPADRAGTAPVALVNKTMADVIWPGADPLGACIIAGDLPDAACSYVVGIVQDVHRSQVREEPSMEYYLPVGQGTTQVSGFDLIVRPRGDAAAAIPTLTRAVRALDQSIWYVDAYVLQERVDPQLRTWRVGAIMLSLFAALALVVAAVGLFSIVAYAVEQRRHELGVRIALGARGWQVVALVLRGALSVTLAGIALGALAALGGGQFAEPLLFETSARDPMLFGSVALILIGISAAASGIPALRARHVDAMTVLRDN